MLLCDKISEQLANITQSILADFDAGTNLKNRASYKEKIQRQVENFRDMVDERKILAAEKLFGERFLGFPALSRTFGLKEVEYQGKLPSLKFSFQELRRAAIRGDLLVLFMDRDEEGHPLTPVDMEERYRGERRNKRDDSIFFNTQARSENKALVGQTVRPGWAFVSTKGDQAVVEQEYGSSKTFEQINFLFNYLKSRYDVFNKGMRLPSFLSSFDQEIGQLYEKTADFKEKDWRKRNLLLRESLFFREMFPSPVELLYIGLIHKMVTGQTFLPGYYVKSNYIDNEGYLMKVTSCYVDPDDGRGGFSFVGREFISVMEKDKDKYCAVYFQRDRIKGGKER